MAIWVNGQLVWHELPEEDHKALLDLVPRSMDEVNKSQMILATYIRAGRKIEKKGLSGATKFLEVEAAPANYPRDQEVQSVESA